MNLPIIPSVSIGGLTAGAYVLATLSSETNVPLGDAIPVGVFVGGLVWYIGRRLQKIEDIQSQMAKNLAERPCQFDVSKCPVSAGAGHEVEKE